jgi:preprotein translocase subunit SecF
MIKKSNIAVAKPKRIFYFISVALLVASIFFFFYGLVSEAIFFAVLANGIKNVLS